MNSPKPASRTLRSGLVATGLLSLGLLALGLPACGGDGDGPAPGKVLIIGLDGAEWNLIHPMVEAGEMPNLAGLMERGISGNLRSLEPPQKSPAIWTTMATGKSPEVHGIRTFVDKEDGKPLTRNLRKARALWNIVSGIDRTAGVVGWLMTWPAESVNGFVVSDYVQYSPGRKGGKLEHRTYPPELEAEIAPRIRPWESFPWSAVMRFLDSPVDTTTMDRSAEALLRPMRWMTAADITFADIGLALYRDRNPDFMAVYLRGMDTMGHLYWNYSFPEGVPETALQPYLRTMARGTMREYYRFTDELIGPFIDAADENTTIIVVSDHGFKGGTGSGIDAHNPDGILVMAGRGVGQGTITGANVYDVTPTALVLMGLPPAEDMPGKVLWAALDETVPRDRFAKNIPTYETGEGAGGETSVQSPVDEEILERLRSLGYID